MLPATPNRLGRYEILDELGKGAAGVVYLAKDPLIGRLVALKTFRVGYSVKDQELQQFRARFIREAQSAGILSHPNIVTIHDVVEESEEGVAFIAMEYVRGTNLKQLLQGGTPLELPFAAEIVRQVGDALDYAHSKGVVHRDVKPANIIITADNRVKITDFGIARIDTSNLTQEGQLLGTPNYMAPEQILGREVDHRADLFSLGVVLYEMLTRHKPFQGENLTVVSHRIVYDQFTPPRQYARDLPPGVERILGKALAKDPAQRFQRARDMVEELRRLTGDRPAAEVESLNETQNLAETAVVGDLPQIGPPPAAGGRGWRRWLGGRRAAAAAPAAAVAPAAAMPAVAMAPSAPAASVAAASVAARSVAAPAGFAAPAGAAMAAAAVPAEDTGSPVLAEVVPLVPAGSQAAPAPARPAPPARSAAPRFARIAALAIGAAAVPVLAVAAGILLVAWGQPPPPDGKVYHPQVVPLLTEGVSLLRAGQAPEAAAKLAGAERLAPGEPVLGRLRREAERALSFDAERQLEIEREIAERSEEGRTALARRAWDQAEAAAERILLLDANHPEARQILDRARAGQEREAASLFRRRQPAVAAPAVAPPAAPPQPDTRAETSAEPQNVARDASLLVELRSELPQGKVIVSIGSWRALDQSFNFRRGFLRNHSGSGSQSWRSTVPAGRTTLRVHVAPAGLPAKVEDLPADFRGGAEHRLLIRIAADGSATAQLY